MPFFGGGHTHGASFWLLDEPVDYDDYEMNRFLFTLGKDAIGDSGLPRARFRADISQPDMTRGLWDGVVDMWMVGGRRAFVASGDIRRAMLPGEVYWSYGGGTSVSAPLVDNLQHALSLWVLKDTGYMPWWNCFGGDARAWQTGNTLSLFYRGQDYPGGDGLYTGPLASVRLKAIRRMQQDMEYLHLLACSPGWSRSLACLALREFADAPDARCLTFQHLTLAQAEQLRRNVVGAILAAGKANSK